MNPLIKCVCLDHKLPKKSDYKIKLESAVTIEIMKKFNLKGTPFRAFVAANHIFIQYKDLSDKYNLIAICKTFFLLVAITVNEIVRVRDQRLIDYLRLVWNHNVIKKKLMNLL
ncbi:hypothetical protein LDVICp216 [lymphocystis disease virus-China]|uniref:Uncharacterized protein n=2 Tax=Lymphocystis disease virus 2 TaxID=159183 RepID=A0A6F8X2T1_9VIRU|nr:hypothetical protein LDVICp216 [lymphocystis disease virus-China]AAU11059.1 hypothetical protein [lymphocystis disease virus-China]BCB67539.1 hypothetical protein [Lymphocystis disease virus 2]